MLNHVAEACAQVKPHAIWKYKDKEYRIQTVLPGVLSQDDKGEWVPSVIYEASKDDRDTQVVGSMPLKFSRPVTEFVSKFKAQ